MPKIFITRKIPERGINKLREKGYEIVINPEDKILSKDELIDSLKDKNYDAVLCLLTDKIDKDVIEAAGTQIKIFANMAVGFDNIDIKSAKEKKIMITNTPEVLTESVAEHTIALMLAISRRIVEADKFTRQGNYQGWAPMLMLGNDIAEKTIGIVGLGRIGERVAEILAKGYKAKIIYHDIRRNESFEKEIGAQYKENLEDLLKEANYVTLHIPLLPATHHLINEEKLKIMKPTSYLINTSRGPIINEQALVRALKEGWIRSAALDVFENEPNLTPGLAELDNVILTPHIASATEKTRAKMSELAAENIIAALEGKTPPNLIS
ncbi:MAG: D-glycerate dehydrogenase [Candidatus Niyogibacteria bacterium RIFCSPLOWO2_12_FULL_41_13]|uniref:D-glycerate dehydrogenase n=1 Tax=Candidatus Niyogibacteria bacterium RIFCSPLOWO2_12_FULL_41_13 TaxID=1801726 RepID=A0A1G2F187_9BACT|nr:MAG: D-glycerate dehydrogenase [Candidatus Niyogibacteria bacterium RIFCSPLOWO2_12_FULL_41_13]